MVQILKQPSFGQLTGEALGTGLSQGLGALANLKLQEIQQRNQLAQMTPALKVLEQQFNIPGLSQLGPLGPQLLAPIIKQKMQEPANQQYAQAAQYMLNQLYQPEAGQIEAQQLREGQQMAPGAEQRIGQQLMQVAGPKQPQLTNITGQQAKDLAVLQLGVEKEKRAREKIAEDIKIKRQAQINKANESYNTQLDKAFEVNQKMYDAALEMQQLLDTGKVAEDMSESLYKYLPNFFINEETQRFQELSDFLAPLFAAQTGNPTNLKVKMAGNAKPSIFKKRAVQKTGVEKILKQSGKTIQRRQIREELIEANGGYQPAGLSSLVEKRFANSKESYKKPVKLPDPKTYSDDAVIEINGNQYERSGNEWKEING